MEKRVYVEHFDEFDVSEPVHRRPDIAILSQRDDFSTGELAEAVEGILACPEEWEETYLVIKERETMRENRRPLCTIYPWTIRHQMPEIQIPLLGKEEVTLNPQEVFNTVYDRARYNLSIDYSATLHHPLTEAELAWMQLLSKPSRDV